MATRYTSNEEEIALLIKQACALRWMRMNGIRLSSRESVVKAWLRLEDTISDMREKDNEQG